MGWPTAPSSGSPELAVDLMLRMNTTDKAVRPGPVHVAPPVFGGGPNTDCSSTCAAWPPTGRSAPACRRRRYTTGTGTNGVFGTVTLSARLDYSATCTAPPRVGALRVTDITTTTTPLTTGRAGVAVHYEQGALTTPPGAPRIESVRLIDTVSGDDFVDDLSPAAGRRLGGAGPVAISRLRADVHGGGAMVPNQEFIDNYNGSYQGSGFAQWSSSFDGDQFCEFEVSNVSKPRPNGAVGGTAMWFEMYMHSGRSDLSARVIRISYDPGYGTSDNIVRWQLWTQGPNGEETSDTVDNELTVGDTDGVFPEPDRLRVESDLTGEVRLYRRGVLLETVTYTNAPVGGRIGVYTSWEADNLFPNDQRRPATARIEQVWAGLQAPLGTEELGLWVRIGVDHQTLGNRWFFRGFVDGVVPVYDPEHADAVRIGCIDTPG